ncbi:MAG: sugar phosphate nucleotidyltransferase [Kiritimatiellales bacterium]
MSNKRAVILAGGKGTRLKPYTAVFPKPLVPVGDVPILEVIIRQLAANGFTHITIALNHLAEIIKAFFGDGSKWGVQIDYSLEDKPLNTMGPLKLIADLPDNFLVMNGDVLTDLNYAELYDAHVAQENLFTISAYARQQKVDFGVLDIGEDKKLTGFREKPVYEYSVSMGIYVLNRNVLEIIPEDTAYGFDELMLELIKRKTPATVKVFDGYWLDIGRPEDYEIACEEASRFIPGDA